jgi:dTDP-4-amino-4,6-dideoxygalactose transaminase
MENVKLINFSKKSDKRGSLIPVESYKDVPFNIERIFYIKGMDDFPRGFHSHRKTVQVITPIAGSFDIELTDSFTTKSYHLEDDSKGLLIPLDIWLKMENFSLDCIILVICSYEYDEKEYVRNFGDFVTIQNQKDETIRNINIDLSVEERGKIHKKMKEIIDNNQFVLGNELKQFEQNFADYIGTQYCVGVSNGTSAMIAALKALNLSKTDEIILQSNTYIAAALASTGYNIKIVDVDENLNIDLELLESSITENTKVVFVVHLYGMCPDMDRLLQLKEKYGFYIIEDAAQAHGSSYKDKKLGSFGDIGCFSFYPTKNLGSFGEGGCITTDNQEIYNYIKKYRNYGSEKKYVWEIKGANERMHNIQAAILNIKLEHLDEQNKARNKLGEIYNNTLQNITGVRIIENHNELYRNYHLYVILVEDREKLQKFLSKNHIQTNIHYPETFYKSLAFKELNHLSFKADEYKHQVLSLPMHPTLKETEVFTVCEKIKSFYRIK